MTKISFFLYLFKKFCLRKQSKHSRSCDLNDVNFAKKMPFVFLIDFSLADENMVETLLYEHMKNVIARMSEKQIYKSVKETTVANCFKDSHTGYRNAMTKYLNKLKST